MLKGFYSILICSEVAENKFVFTSAIFVCSLIILFFVFSNKSHVFLHLVLSFLQLATLLLNFTHFVSENILNKLLLAKPTMLVKNISCFKRIIIIIWLTKYGISTGG